MSFSIQPISAFKDNYIWAMVHLEKKTAWVVDPGDATPVIDFLEKNNFNLSGILITHHHHDHCGGVDKLKEQYEAVVYGPETPAIFATHIVKDEQTIFIADFDITLKVLTIPGHTLDHVAYYCESKQFLFCGDTLFSAGCGRVFEGTFEQMYQSLTKIANLPESTQLYCGHEYTLSNLKFAKHVDPENADIDRYIAEVTKCRGNNLPSLPSSLLLEKKVNPFLRTASEVIIRSLERSLGKGVDLHGPAQIFEELRKMKDKF